MLTTILAGALMLPSALVMVGSIVLVGVLSLPGLALLCYKRPEPQKKSSQKKRRAIITGGSSGIGLSTAHVCIDQGFAEIYILARNKEKLEAARKELQAKVDQHKNKDCQIQALSVDISKPEALEAAAKTIFTKNNKDKKDSVEDNDYFNILFCIAGATWPEHFRNLPATTFASLVQTNQLGTIYTVQAFLPYLQGNNNDPISQKPEGTILFCSSMAGQVGTFGYTAYAPTKAALLAFAQALHMELCAQTNLSVCVAYPPDTDTPCYEKENETKPYECQIISEAGGKPADPMDIAKIFVDKATMTNPPFNIYCNFDGWMLSTLTCGLSPVTGLFDIVCQVAGMGLFRLIGLFYHKEWIRMIRNYQLNSSSSSSSSSSNDKKKTEETEDGDNANQPK